MGQEQSKRKSNDIAPYSEENPTSTLNINIEKPLKENKDRIGEAAADPAENDDSAQKNGSSQKDDSGQKYDLAKEDVSTKKDDSVQKNGTPQKDDPPKNGDSHKKDETTTKDESAQKDNSPQKYTTTQEHHNAQKDDNARKEGIAHIDDSAQKDDIAQKDDQAQKDDHAQNGDKSQKNDEAQKGDKSQKSDKAQKGDIAQEGDLAQKGDKAQNGDKAESGIHDLALKVDVTQYEYPFENLVFEGGGMKASAYCGALRMFEELGITVASGKIKRLCGTSAGSLVALLCALGYTADDIEQKLCREVNYSTLFDHKFGVLSFLPNLFSDYGWNSGKKMYKWLGDMVARKTGDSDLTFSQLYALMGVELCAVAVNLNQKRVKYCHVKTTPDMPLRLAVKMSMSFPVLYSPPSYEMCGYSDLFVDGGLLCNYPIHAFDGWWLSMKKEDGYFSRLRSISEMSEMVEKGVRFGEYNDRTVGLVVYSEDEEDLFRSHLQNRVGTEFSLADVRDTKIGRKYKAKSKLKAESVQEYQRVIGAIDSLAVALTKHDANDDQKITLDEFKHIMDDKGVLDENERRILFEPGLTVKQIFDDISQCDNEITYFDLKNYLEKRGLRVQSKVIGYKRKEIRSLSNFFEMLRSTLVTNAAKVFMEQRDVLRTIGINTGYVSTLEFGLEAGDRQFLVERGRISAEAFLKYYVVWNKLQPKEPQSVIPEEEPNNVSMDSGE